VGGGQITGLTPEQIAAANTSNTVPGFAKGGETDDMAIVGEGGPELAMALPGGGFRVVPLDAKRLPKGIKKAQFGGVFGSAPLPGIQDPRLSPDTSGFGIDPALGGLASGTTGSIGNVSTGGVDRRREELLQAAGIPQFSSLAGAGQTLPAPPDVTQEQLQGFAQETLFPNVRSVFGGGAGRPQGFSFALPTFRGLSSLSADDRANAETALRLGAIGGRPTTLTDVEASVRNRFLPQQGRGGARVAGF